MSLMVASCHTDASTNANTSADGSAPYRQKLGPRRTVCRLSRNRTALVVVLHFTSATHEFSEDEVDFGGGDEDTQSAASRGHGCRDCIGFGRDRRPDPRSNSVCAALGHPCEQLSRWDQRRRTSVRVKRGGAGPGHLCQGCIGRRYILIVVGSAPQRADGHEHQSAAAPERDERW